MKEVQEVLDEFYTKAQSFKETETTVLNRSKNIKVTKTEVLKRIEFIAPKKDSKFYTLMTEHYSFFERLIHFSSTPMSFKLAWDLRSNQLLLRDADNFVTHGAQLIPQIKGSGIFEFNMKGLIVSPCHKGILLGVRHSEGNYEDQLDDLGRFTYQPPEDLLGMIRYRYFEHISRELNIPYLMFVSMWFDLNNSSDITLKKNLPEETNWVFVVCPVKVISFNEFDNRDINKPLTLQLITRREASDIINKYKGLSANRSSLKFRPGLRENLSLEFSYEHVKSSKKGRAIKTWAQESGKKCPGCSITFSNFNQSDLTFGHIISQDWAGAFNFLADKAHDPDNLYLTCRGCNSSLNKYFPDKDLQIKITSNSYGTVGDWLRESEVEIRKKIL